MTLHELMDAAFQAMGFAHARGVDVMVVSQIAGVGPEDEANDEVFDAAADLIWDHWMGEPEEPSFEEVEAGLREIASAHDARDSDI